MQKGNFYRGGLDLDSLLITFIKIQPIKSITSTATTTGMMKTKTEPEMAAAFSVVATTELPAPTVALLLRPKLFSGKHCNIAIETQSSLTLGHTAVDFWGVSRRAKNADWIYAVDADGFYELLTERLARFSDR